MEDRVSAEIQRSLGRIEGTQKEMSEAQKKIFSILEQLSKDFIEHKGDDRNNFQTLSSRMGVLEKSIATQTHIKEDTDKERSQELGSLRAELKTLNDYVENIKGAWWLIGIVGVLVASFGALVTWFITVWNAKHG
jgi:hypothetical protein